MRKATKMADKADEARARAESSFKKQEQRSREAKEARDEQSAKERAVDDKTARLKVQRLAKEAADREAAPPADPLAKRSRKPK
jgi:hypothetical protein